MLDPRIVLCRCPDRLYAGCPVLAISPRNGAMSPASQLAPTGTLRVAVWMVPYFARGQGGGLSGIIPDLAAALARAAGVEPALVPFENPARIVAAFRDGALDVTFVGITADRAEAIDFGPRVFE